MGKLILGIILGLILASGAQAKEPGWGLGVESVELGAYQVVNRKAALLQDIPHEDWGHRIEINPHLTLLKRGYFNSTWFFNTAYKKVIEAGLHFDTGVQVCDWLALEYKHTSIHGADRGTSFENPKAYELGDYVGLRLKFIP